MKHKPFSDAVDEYLSHLRAKGLERNTIRTHETALRGALALIGNIYVANIKPEHIDKVFAAHTWAPPTHNLKLVNYRLFFAYCRRQGWMNRDYDPTEGWRPLKAPRVEMPRIGIEDFARVLDAATDPRDRAVVALGLFTFCRASEIQTLRIKDLDFDANTVSIYRHKTKEADTLPMVTELKTEMVQWLNEYRRQTGELDGDWYLVPAKGPLPMTHNPLTNRLAPSGAPAPLNPTKAMSHPYRAAGRPLKAIGLTEKGVGGHVLRRSGARCLFDRLRSEGYDGALRRVQAMLGHSKAAITEHYLGLELERVQRNEMLAGKPMFPDMPVLGTVSELKAV